MDLKEWKLKPVQEEKYILEEFDGGEKEETLSLCDLALSVSDSSDGSFKEDQSSSYDQDLFEFFSQDLSTNNSSIYPKDTIIFCGKLIPCKGEFKEDENYKETKSNSTKKSSIFAWKSYNLNIARSKSVKMQREKSYRDSKSSLSPDKKRYFWAFGAGGRYPAEMELKDIKTRQSKIRSPVREIKGEKREKNNWWGLLRILGCQSSHANAMVKASLGVMPDV